MEENLGVTEQNSSTVQNASVEPSYQSQQSIIDTFNTLMDQGAPKTGQSNNTFSYIPTAGLDMSGKYPKVYATLDNEELYARNQGTAEKLGNGVAKFAGIAASTFVNGTAGLVYGVFDWARTGEFKSVYDNDLTRELNEFNNEYLETTFANYKTQREINGDWWEPENLFTANFLADNIIKNLGFAVGAIGGGFAWSGALKAIGLTSKLVAQGKNMAAAADAAVASANALPQTQRLSTINTALNNLYNSARVGAGTVLKGADRGIVATFGSAGEAGIEALNASQEFRQSQIDKYIADNGYAPKGQDLIDINENAENVGKTVYGLNIGLLSISNFVQLPKIFSSTFKGEKAIVNDVMFQGGKYVSALPTKGVAKNIYKARNIAGLLFNTDEALEEAAQFASQVGTENYFSKLEETGDASILDDLFFEGAKEAFTTSEGLLNFFIGGVSGALMTSGIPTLGMTGAIKERGFTGYGGEKEKLRNQTIDLFNKSLIKDKLKDSAKIINASEKIQQERAQKISEGDVSGAKDLEFDFLFGTMLNRAKYTSIEFVNEEIKELKNRALTDDGFLQLQQEGYAYKTDSKESFTNRLNNISKQAEYINKSYQDINLKYRGVVDENGKPVYSSAVIDKLTYAASKIFDYDLRIPSLNNKLTASGINTAELFSDVILNGTPTTEAVNKALAEIKSKGSVNEDELTQDLFELVEMGLKRKKFIDEYKEMKEKPSKFTPSPEVESTIIPEEKVGERVKIVTKDGEKNYEIGVEYFLGKVVEYDANGKEVYRFPKLTIVAQNEDGTIRIKTDKGERNISPEVLKDYKLGKVSTVANNPEASFYMENINTIVEWNMGKGKGGVKSGRLEFDSENNQLMFTYVTKTKKGKRFIKSIPIDLKSFEPKKGFQKALFSLGRELTATEKNAIQKSKENAIKATPNTLYDLNAQDARAQLINDYHAEVIEKQAEVEKTIKEKKADILTIEEELDKINKVIEKGGDDARAKRGTRLKSSVRKALDAAMRLSRAKEELLQEVDDLEAQKEDGELLLVYLEDAIQNISELSGNAKSIIDQLEFETELLKESIEENGKQIGALSKLADEFENSLDFAISFLRNLVDQFETNYPKVPRILGAEFIEFLKVNPNFLKLKPNYVSDLRELDRLIAETEDMEIFPSEKKLTELIDKIKSLKENLQINANELIFKEALLAKMKKAYQEYEASGIEEEKLMKNEALKKQILGTADNNNPVAPLSDKEYEVTPKKSVDVIPRSTLGIDKGKPHQKRAQRFGMNFESIDDEQKKNIKGVYITSKNQDQLIPGLMDHLRTDENGIDESIDPNTIIAMVMVDMSTGVPVLIGKDGQPLTEEELQDPLNNSIYQVFPLQDLKWSGEYGNESMFPKGTPENVENAIREQYTQWRNKILQLEDLSEIHSIDVSFGIPQVNKDSEGKKLYDTRTSVQDAGLVSDYELNYSPIITIASSEETIIRGISVTKSSPGRVFLDMNNGLVPLNNRQHTKQEAEVIFNAILQFSKNVFDKTKGVNDDQSKRLLSFLKSVVYWGIPANDSGFSSVFFKDDRLFMSGKGQSFPFTPSGLLQNKDSIITVLTGMYHNVNGKIARDGIGTEYEQITNISEDGTIESVTWANYQTYLLSNTTPDGKKRTGEEIPLSTYMRPLEGPDDINRSGIYFYTTDTVDEYDIPEPEKKTKIVPVSKTVSDVPIFVLDGETPNELKSSKTDRVIVFAAPSENPTLENIKIFKSDDLESVMADFESQGKDPKIAIKQMVLKVVLNQLSLGSIEAQNSKIEKTRERLFGKKSSDSTNKISESEETETEIETDKDSKIEKTRSKLFGKKSDDSSKVEKNTPSTFDEESESTNSIDEEAERISREIDEAIKPSRRSGRSDFREVVENQAKSGMIEDWSEIEAAWKKMLPGVPLYRLKNIIQATNGRQAWGMLKNGAIYVYENAEVGTFYHEVFEAVWKMFTNPVEQQAILTEFKSRTGTFIDRPTGETVKYSEATPEQIKEQLAEEFRDYVLFKKAPIKAKDSRSWIVKLFSDIVNIIKKLFTGKDANLNTETLFKRIGNGYYSKSIPSIGVLQDVPSQIIDIDDAFATEEDELRAITISYKQQHELIQHMAFETLAMLGLSDQSLFNVTNIDRRYLKNVLFSKIVTGETTEDGELIPGILLEQMHANKENKKDGKISNAEFVANHRSIIQLTEQVNSEWDELFDKYEEYMKQYSIQFDENDELQIFDEDKTREINPDATKIDGLRKANAAIKLLLATLPKMTTIDGKVVPKTSSVGGYELLPLNQTFITVMNNLYMSRDVSEMMENLRKLALDDINYLKLYKRIAKKDPNAGIFDFKKLNTPHSIQLLSSFYNTFKKQNPDVKNVFILDNGDVVVGDANLSQAFSQIASDYESGIILSAREGKGYFEYSPTAKAYIVKDKIDKLRFDSSNIVDNDNAMLKFLSDIGVEFDKSDFAKLDKDQKTIFRTAVKGIRDSFVQNKELMTLSKKTISIQGRLTKLAMLKVQISNPEVESTYFNISNERTQSYIGVNPLSDLREFIASVSNINSNKVLESHYKYLVLDPFAKGSVILNRLFSKEGKSIPKDHADADLLSVSYVGGTKNDTNGKQKPSAKLNYSERIIQEINLNLEGYYLNLVPGDASIEWMVKMGNHVSSTNMSVGYQKVMEIFKEYFKAEYNLAKSQDRFVDSSRIADKNNLRFFYDILGKELNNDIIASKEVDADAVYKKFEKKIETAVKNYIETKTTSFRNTLTDYNIIRYDGTSFKLNNVQKSDSNMYNLSDSMNEQTLNNNLKALTVNYMIANIELHKLMYSDPYQYKDELKRIKSFSSPRQAIMSNPDNLNSGFNINQALQDTYNVGFEKGDIGYTDFNRNYFRSVTHSDVIGVIDIPGQNYEAYKETDGSGIISFKAHRNLKIRAGQWTDNNELQYRHDIAYEKLVKSGVDQDTLNEFEKNNPDIKDTYTPVKPIVAGNIENEQGYNDVLLDKYALYPLSFRILHKIKKDSNAIKLYEKMQKEDVDYIVFNSGRKVGARNPHSTYTVIDGTNEMKFNDSLYVEDGKDKNIVNVPFKIISIQTEVPSKDKADVTRGSQVTKLLTMDFMAAGVPVDYMPNESNFAIRYKSWMALDENGKQQSKLYKEIKNNRELLTAMTELGYKSLLKRLGIEKTKDGYKITNFSLTAETLKSELLKREVNDNVIESLKSFSDGNVILEATPAYQQIRNILYSIVDSEIVSPKISGGMKVQIPSTLLLDSENVKVATINGKTGFVSETLKFYEKDGERVAEIMVGRWFDSPLSDDELLEYLNNTDEGKKILKGIAFRTPTQNQNSIDAIKIAKFLPREFGDSVVVPSALVAKVGSDFDIDKLSIYFKNVKIGKNGIPQYIKFLDDSNSKIEERYVNWIRDFVQLDTKKYVSILSKDELNKIREKYSKIRKNSKIDTSKLISESFDSLHSQMVDTRESYISEARLEVDERMKYLFNEGSLYFRELPEYMKDIFFNTKKRLFTENINGPKEIEIYLQLALVLKNNQESSEVLETLDLMISNYEESLLTLGISEKYVKEVMDFTIDEFRGKKSLKLAEILNYANDVRSKITSEYEMDKLDVKFDGAKQMAEIENLPTFEEFSKFNIYNQNTKKALENAYIESSENLIKSDENYDKLMTPNSAKQLEDLSEEIAKKTVGQSYDYKNVGNMLDRNFMSSLRHAFVTGKNAIGIAAVNQTNHSLMQRFASFIDPARLINVSEVDKHWLGDAKVKFQQFNRFDGKATLSMIKNSAGQFISDIVGQFIDGYVDISNGPWIMELGATPNVASTWLFLVKIGVPIDTVAYFMNQPIIREYLKQIENSGYSWLFIDNLVEETIQKYNTTKSTSRESIPTTEALRNMVGKNSNELTQDEKADQQFILGEFLKYAKMAEHLYQVTQGTNYDTSNFNDPLLLFKKHEQFKKAQQTIISSVDEILDNSFIGQTAQSLNDVRDATGEILISDKSRVRNVIHKVLKPYVDMNDRNFVKLGRKVVSDLFDYAVQTNTTFKNSVLSTMITNGGYAYDIVQMVKEIKSNPKHPLFDNHVINIIVPQLAPEASPKSVNNIKVKGASNKVYDQNSIIYSFKELKEYLESIGEAFKYNKFKMLALYQSGLSTNKLSFMSLLPFEDFENIYKSTIEKINNIPNLESFANLNVFERNNWGDDSIVTYEKAKWIKEKDGTPAYNPAMKYLPNNVKDLVENGDIPPIMSMSTLGRNSNSDLFVYSWEENISKEKKAEMRKKGDYSYIKRGLFKKVKDVNDEPYIYTNSKGKNYYILQAINAWGARERAQEFYDVEKVSAIDNGFIKVPNVAADSRIISIFDNSRKSKSVQSSVTATTQTRTQAPTSVTKPSSVQNFQGYRGGFEDVGKSSPQGDGKDKAMRQVADGFIGEIVKQDSSSATSKKEIENKVISAKGKMTFSYGNNKRVDVNSSTTFEAIKNGERIATTRYESDGNIDYWKKLKEGDIIEWESATGEKVLVKVTKPLHKLIGSGKTAEQWSKLEGWSVEYFNNKVKPKLNEAWQIEYKTLQNNIVMLARNSEFKGQSLKEETKQQILQAHNAGAEFVVGDMPNVDSQFIDYLQEIGAKFTIYHTGNAPRIQIDKNKTQAPKEGEMKLKNGKTYPYSKINSKMLEVIGYSSEEIGKILKSIC